MSLPRARHRAGVAPRSPRANARHAESSGPDRPAAGAEPYSHSGRRAAGRHLKHVSEGVLLSAHAAMPRDRGPGTRRAQPGSPRADARHDRHHCHGLEPGRQFLALSRGPVAAPRDRGAWGRASGRRDSEALSACQRGARAHPRHLGQHVQLCQDRQTARSGAVWDSRLALGFCQPVLLPAASRRHHDGRIATARRNRSSCPIITSSARAISSIPS
jgi:hypothetical protein